MKYFKTLLFILILLTVACNINDFNEDEPQITNHEPLEVGIFIDDWTFKVFPNFQDNFDTAEFKLWIPENINNLKAILILCNHNNGSSFGWLRLEEWRTIAETEKLALLAVNLETLTVDGHYTNPTGGSGNALIKALDTITYRNNLDNLNKLPVLMTGYSAGGVFSYYFSHFKPERVIAFTNIRGGAVGETSSINNNIPGLMLMGENDNQSRNDRMMDVVHSKRNAGGVWGYAVEPNVDHFGNLQTSHALARKFFSAVLSKRLIPDSNQLIDIPENSGWLGNNETKDIFPFDEYPNEVNEATWLIDEAFANLWRTYQLD
jgi:hypothetical protein